MKKIIYILKAVVVVGLCVCIRIVCDVTGKVVTEKIVNLTLDKEKKGGAE